MSEGGGASGRRGFEFQDLATAYYCLTDKPEYQSETERPQEFKIERKNSDFYYVIRTDDVDYQHFFEAKTRKGKLEWSEFTNNIIEEFGGILAQYANLENSINFHLVANNADPRVWSLFEDINKLKENAMTYERFKDKHQYRSKFLFDVKSSLKDDGDIYRLVHGLQLHTHSLDELRSEFRSYVRDCSPGNYTSPMKCILRRINETNGGHITRDQIEDAADISLRKQNTSSDSGEFLKAQSQLSDLANRETPPTKKETIKYETAAKKVGEKASKPDNSVDSGVETHVTGIADDMEAIRGAKDTISSRTDNSQMRADLLVNELPSSMMSEGSEEEK